MTRRVLWAVALGLGVLIVSLFTWDAVTRQITSNRLRDRTAYWSAAVGSGVRVGETREEAERWLRKTFRTQPGNRDFYDEYNHSLVASAETIEVVGVTFPCAAWMILVDIELGADGRVTSRTVKTAGACV
ncbi:MAG TPA: hypothetical protein VF495_21265 [Phenylobacterium sp.]